MQIVGNHTYPFTDLCAKTNTLKKMEEEKKIMVKLIFPTEVPI